MTCAILDIPVYEDNYVEALHVLFTLFSAFKNNPHFGGQDEAPNDLVEDTAGADVMKVDM